MRSAGQMMSISRSPGIATRAVFDPDTQYYEGVPEVKRWHSGEYR